MTVLEETEFHWGGKYCGPGVVELGLDEYPKEEEPLEEEAPEKAE